MYSVPDRIDENGTAADTALGTRQIHARFAWYPPQIFVHFFAQILKRHTAGTISGHELRSSYRVGISIACGKTSVRRDVSGENVSGREIYRYFLAPLNDFLRFSPTSRVDWSVATRRLNAQVTDYCDAALTLCRTSRGTLMSVGGAKI